MGNIGIDVSKEELAKQHRDALRIINEQRQTIEGLTERVEKLENSIVELWHAAADDHIGTLWKCLGLDQEEYLEWAKKRVES